MRFVISAIEANKLVRGDYFVIDGAAIHVSADTLPMLRDVLQAAGVTLVYLPTYSPELNPCELVFSFIKKRMREYSNTNIVWLEIMSALAELTYQHVFKFYKRCIDRL